MKLFTKTLFATVGTVGVATTGLFGTAVLTAHSVQPAGATASPGPLVVKSALVPKLAVTTNAAKLLAAYAAQLAATQTRTAPGMTGPSIVVTEPARGSFTTQGATLVKGSVSDASGITMVTVNGQPVTTDAQGGFSEAIGLTPGMNTIEVAAVNSLHVTNKVSLSVVSGQFRPDDQPIEQGLALRLNQGSFDAACKVIASKMTGPVLADALMKKNPLAHWSSWVGSAKVNATGASFGQPVLAITPEPGDLRVHVEIPNVSVSVHESGSGIIPSLTGHAGCKKAVLDARISIVVDNGTITTAVVNDSVSLQGFDWGINYLPDFLTGLFSGLVRDKIQSEVASMVKKTVPPEVNKMIGGATGQPITQKILGQTATFTLAPAALSVDGSGLSATVNADCSLSPVAGFTPLDAPGSLITSGPVPTNGGPGPDFFASANEDLLNRAGYAVWKSGVSRLVIDDSPGSAFKMPTGYPLDMGLLLTFLPELKGTADPSDALTLTITPLLPPIFKAVGKPDTLQANLGEVRMEFTDKVTGQSIIALAVHIRAKATLQLDATNRFTVHMSDRPWADASLVSSAAPGINTIGIDNVISLFVPTIVQIAGNQWSGFPLPTYPGLVPVATSIYADGAKTSFVTAAANFHVGGAPLPTGKPSLSAILAATGLASKLVLVPPAPKPLTAVFGGALKVSPSTIAAKVAKLGSILNKGGTNGASGGGQVVLPGETITAHTGYVALVADGLENAVAPLLAGYESRGVSVALVPLSHVKAPGKDRAEEIRNWLVAHCKDGVKRSLLLVGGPQAIPFRTCQPSPAVTTVVTDLYYGDLHGDWDANGDGVYGGIDDEPGFDPDLYVGRLPFDDAASVETAVKAIELARSQSNKGAWSNRALLVGATTIVPGDDPIGAATARAIAFAPNGWDTKTAFAPESFLKGDEVLGETTIVDELSAQPAALLLTFSHGSTKGLMSHPDDTTWHDVLTIPQLASLPKDRPPVEIAVACNTADPTNGPCIGSISLQNGLAGWIGCTVVTDPRSGGGAWLLMTTELSKEIASGNSLGVSVARAMRDYTANGLVATQGNDDATANVYQQAMSWICYGDPGLAIGPKAP